MNARLAVLCLILVGAAAVLSGWRSAAFLPYYGPVPPVVGTALVALAALGSLSVLERGGWLRIRRMDAGWRGAAIASAMATVLSMPVIVVDLLGGFPADINVMPPDSLLFYPVIALVAETVFHLAPLALLLPLAARALPDLPRDRVLLACLLLVAFPEAVFQVAIGAGGSPPWANAYVGLHLVVFSICGLLLFRRFDFFALYALRLVYYGLWHVLWGVIRL